LTTLVRRLDLGTVLVVAAAALWGCWSIVFRSAEASSSRPLSAAMETAVVFLVMLVAMAPLALWTRRSAVQVGTAATRPARAFLVVGALGVVDALNALCFFEAMQRTTVAIAVLCHYLTPVIVALLSPLVLGEPRRRSTLVALALSLAGLVLLLQPWGRVSVADVEGAALASLSAVFYAASLFLGKRLITTFSTWELAAWPKLASVPILVLAAAFASGGLALELAPGLILVVGGLVCGALPLWLFYAGLSRLQASQVSVLTLVEPLVAVLVGVVVWGEPLAAVGVVGGALVLWGAGIIARAGARDAVPS
jgi:drug/metabolite transporter (DMT)-like permease